MRKINISKEEIKGLYVNQKLSSIEIAKKFGVSHQTILNRMKEYNIQSRTISESLSFEKVRKKISEALRGEKHPFYNKHLSEEHKRKISAGHLGKHLSEEAKKRMSESQKGNKNNFYGKHHSEETKRKISEAEKGKYISEETRKRISEGRWKGGLKVAWMRKFSKRRQLGFTPLNQPFENCEAHHLQDKETVIYIPKELHRRIHHNNWTGKNMNNIDALALHYLELQILGEVI